MKIRIHNPIYGVPITFLDKWRPFEPVYILNPDRYANEYIISSVIKPFISVSCLIPTQFRIVGIACGNTRASYPKSILDYVHYIPNPNDRGGCGVINGIRCYARILIQKI